MRSTIKTGRQAATITADRAGVVLTITNPDGTGQRLELDKHQAAMLAGELERGAWRCERLEGAARAAA